MTKCSLILQAIQLLKHKDSLYIVKGSESDKKVIIYSKHKMEHLFQIIVFPVRVKFTAELFHFWTEYVERNSNQFVVLQCMMGPSSFVVCFFSI
jgi:hypothetical protein